MAPERSSSLIRARRRRVAVVEGRRRRAGRCAARPARMRPALFGGRRHRLLGDDVDAGLERRDDDVGVGVVARADDQRFGAAFAPASSAQVGEDRRVGADRRARARRARIEFAVAKPDELDPCRRNRRAVPCPMCRRPDGRCRPARRAAFARAASGGVPDGAARQPVAMGRRRSSTRSQIWSSDSSAAVCGSIIAA